MALNLDEMSKKMDDFFNSEEGKESVRKFWEEQEEKTKKEEEQVEKFYQENKDNMKATIEKIIAEYESDEYVKNEYKLGYEPRTPLYWLLKSVAEKYGETVKPTKKNSHKWRQYINMFTAEAYIYEGYFIQVMHGQGSVVRIDLIDNSPEAFAAWRKREKEFKKQMKKVL
jgi:hypothetical protein